MKNIVLAFLLCSAFHLAAVNYADYGAGPMLKPARTFYVSPKGSDKNDGKTLKTAFKTLPKGFQQLRAGDTLLIDEGIYFQEELKLNVKDGVVGFAEQCGKPGSPIRIMGMKGKKVILTGGRLLEPVKKSGQIAEYKYSLPILNNLIHERPSGIELQNVDSEELAREIPGTFFYDMKNKRLLVHYAALDQTGISASARRIGIRIHGSYIHLENLEFRHYYEAVYARMNRPYDKNKASHITIQNCRFFYNTQNGVVLDGTSWSVVKNNQAAFNTTQGHFLNMAKATDNLYLGNWCGTTAHTLRQKRENVVNYGINSYGGRPPRNHTIANYVESSLSFRWKSANPDGIIKDNVFRGAWHTESQPVPATITGNLFLGRFSWPGVCGDSGWEEDLKNTPMKMYGNFRKESEFRCDNPELAKAKSLKLTFPAPRFPAVTFKDLKIAYIGKEGAALIWETPDCDGWGEAVVNKKGDRKQRYFSSGLQGARHSVGITGLEPDTVYEVRAFFRNRRGGKSVYSKKYTFKTALKDRDPKVLEVGKGKMTLEEASIAAVPGDTIKLLPGCATDSPESPSHCWARAPFWMPGNFTLPQSFSKTDIISLSTASPLPIRIPPQEPGSFPQKRAAMSSSATAGSTTWTGAQETLSMCVTPPTPLWSTTSSRGDPIPSGFSVKRSKSSITLWWTPLWSASTCGMWMNLRSATTSSTAPVFPPRKIRRSFSPPQAKISSVTATFSGRLSKNIPWGAESETEREGSLSRPGPSPNGRS